MKLSIMVLLQGLCKDIDTDQHASTLRGFMGKEVKSYLRKLSSVPHYSIVPVSDLVVKVVADIYRYNYPWIILVTIVVIDGV